MRYRAIWAIWAIWASSVGTMAMAVAVAVGPGVLGTRMAEETLEMEQVQIVHDLFDIDPMQLGVRLPPDLSVIPRKTTTTTTPSPLSASQEVPSQDHSQNSKMSNRTLQTRSDSDSYKMLITPPPSWWVLHEPDKELGYDIGVSPDANITLTFDCASTSVGVRLAVGSIAGGTGADGTITLGDTSGLTTWECLAGWAAKPTKAVTLTIADTPHTRHLETDGDAYVACETPPPGPKGVESVVASGSGSGSASASPSPSSVLSPSPSASADPPPQPTPTPTLVPSPSPSLAAPNPANASASASADASPSPTSGYDSASLDSTYQAAVWLEVPDPAVSVRPLDPRVGDWNAAGPFRHVFAFHAWVPTYLSEAFEIYTKGPEAGWVSATQCTVGISSKPAGTEVATFTITTSAPYVTPSGMQHGAFMRC